MTFDENKVIGRINLGLCCINTVLRKKNIFNSRNLIRRTFTVEKAEKLAIQNVKDLIPMIEYNYQNDINCFRWSSDIFPHFTDMEVDRYTIDFAKEHLERAGALAKKYNQRIVMHPGQYNQVGAVSRDVFEKTVFELSHHADILDMAGIDENGVLIVHGGGIYGDKNRTKDRWIRQFRELPEKVQKRLVIENCEKCYSVMDVLDISKMCNIPVVHDCHHYFCYYALHQDEKMVYPKSFLEDTVKSWGNRKMLCHVSSQGSGQIGHHADLIEEIPEYMLSIPQKFNIDIDIEVEAKLKEQAIFDLRKKYSKIFNNKCN